MEIVGYISYGVLLFFDITWIWAIRDHPAYRPSLAMTSFLLNITAISIPLFGIPLIHSLWLLPVILLYPFIHPLLLAIPGIRFLLITPIAIYKGILCFGVPTAKWVDPRIKGGFRKLLHTIGGIWWLNQQLKLLMINTVFDVWHSLAVKDTSKLHVILSKFFDSDDQINRVISDLRNNIKSHDVRFALHCKYCEMYPEDDPLNKSL